MELTSTSTSESLTEHCDAQASGRRFSGALSTSSRCQPDRLRFLDRKVMEYEMV